MRNGAKPAMVEGNPSEESLVPVIEEEERRLAETLEAARAQAAERVQAAEREAEKRVDEVKRRIPAMKEERRKEALAEFEGEAGRLRASISQSRAELEDSSRAGRNEAVSRIVEAVWPARRQ